MIYAKLIGFQAYLALPFPVSSESIKRAVTYRKFIWVVVIFWILLDRTGIDLAWRRFGGVRAPLRLGAAPRTAARCSK